MEQQQGVSFALATPNPRDSHARNWSSTVLCQKPDLTITGYSRSTDRTFFYVPELKLGLDAGTAKRDVIPEVILLTHTHDDHSNALPYHADTREGLRVYCPKQAEKFTEGLIRAYKCANSCKDWDESMGSHILTGVEGGDQFFFGKNDQYRVSVVDCIHSVPCVGFTVDERRKKLKEEVKKLSGREIAKLRQSGVEVSEDYFHPLFVFMGDTHITAFKKNPQLFNYPTIVVECTFIKDEAEVRERADRDGHIHWNDLEGYVLAHPEIKFILIHWSLRYTEPEVVEFFEEKSKELNLSNVTLMVNQRK